jgi:hypothetical protein
MIQYSANIRYALGQDLRSNQLSVGPLPMAIDRRIFGGPGNSFWEIWVGLPRGLKFSERESRGDGKTRGGMGWVYEKGNTYIYVPPTTVAELKQNRNLVLYAFGKRTENGLHISSVELPTEKIQGQLNVLESAIADARGLNAQLLWANDEAEGILQQLFAHFGEKWQAHNLSFHLDVPPVVGKQVKRKRKIEAEQATSQPAFA